MKNLKIKISAVIFSLYLCSLVSCRDNNNQDRNAGETGIDQYDGPQDPATTPGPASEPEKTTRDTTKGGSPHSDSLSGSEGTISQPATKP